MSQLRWQRDGDLEYKSPYNGDGFEPAQAVVRDPDSNYASSFNHHAMYDIRRHGPTLMESAVTYSGYLAKYLGYKIVIQLISARKNIGIVAETLQTLPVLYCIQHMVASDQHF